MELARDLPVFNFEGRRFFPLDPDEEAVWGPSRMEYAPDVTRAKFDVTLASKTTSLVDFVVEGTASWW